MDPTVTLIANDNWVEFTLRYIVDYRSRRKTKDRLFTRVLERIDAQPDRVGMASATFHLVEAPTLSVRMVAAIPNAVNANAGPLVSQAREDALVESEAL